VTLRCALSFDGRRTGFLYRHGKLFVLNVLKDRTMRAFHLDIFQQPTKKRALKTSLGSGLEY
jgi:hypothetical protein